VLRTNTDLNPVEVMLCNKQLWIGTNLSHRQASPFDPSDFSQTGRNDPGHVFCSFLALIVKKALEDRIIALGASVLGLASSPILNPLPRLNSNKTASASCSAPRHNPPPPSHCARQALRYRLPCTSSIDANTSKV
jgi:hypothetical protein